MIDTFIWPLEQGYWSGFSSKNNGLCCVTGSQFCSRWRFYSGNRWHIHISVFTCCSVSLTTECTVCQAQRLAGPPQAARLYNTIIHCNTRVRLIKSKISCFKSRPYAVSFMLSSVNLPWSGRTAPVKVILYAHAMRRSRLAWMLIGNVSAGFSGMSFITALASVWYSCCFCLAKHISRWQKMSRGYGTDKMLLDISLIHDCSAI